MQDLFLPGFRQWGVPSGPFIQNYRCHSMAIGGKPEMEKGGKIVLPPSALERLSQLRIDYPMLFQLTNPSTGRKTHAGVLEFTSEEGVCYIPYWMMQHLLLEEGGYIKIQSTTLPLGTFVKLQAHSSDFLDVSNPRAVLENSLRNFATLTAGEVIMIHYNNKNYYFNVLEIKPENASHGISVIETDLEVDFAPPLDYKEPAPKPESKQEEVPKETTATEVPQEQMFMAFSGTGMRLDGKPAPSSAPVPIPRRDRSTSSTSVSSSLSPGSSGNSALSSNSLSNNSAENSESVRFGGKSRKKRKDQPPQATSPPADNKKSFVPFGGSGYSLKG